ncbi:MAG: DUF1045 domain-containing protein [Paracoccus sp. (in: a-proteobacteria)]|uniref:DUF1045 domain-containing protein n=1 Tax=Paracoccus sp. TaxID=267 RepID=UPI0026E0E515|nr:DUF1045 domain-containing protein [Paracoccus sp. (in: a-proteobacteria)]MDO5630909.1 DUF1045 domain-containing protein [Paracoccus sp. (in: a-proteobacteria)]
MTKYRRFAIYYTPPPGDLARFGAAWLGWDSAAGRAVDHPALRGLDPAQIAALTAVPRRYGFHATLRPPFAAVRGEGALAEDLAALAARLPPVDAGDLALARIGGFLALVPQAQPGALTDLAAALVRGLDAHRPALTPQDRARRNPDALSPRERALLDRWGYPWVFEAFRFHMTLTGPGVPETVEDALRPVLDLMLPRPLVIDAVTLSGEDDQGRFHDIARYPLLG